jgi:hypothetical protein
MGMAVTQLYICTVYRSLLDSAKTMQTPPDGTALAGGKLSLQLVVTARSDDTHSEVMMTKHERSRIGNPCLVGRKSAVINTDARILEVGYQ